MFMCLLRSAWSVGAEWDVAAPLTMVSAARWENCVTDLSKPLASNKEQRRIKYPFWFFCSVDPLQVKLIYILDFMTTSKGTTLLLTVQQNGSYYMSVGFSVTSTERLNWGESNWCMKCPNCQTFISLWSAFNNLKWAHYCYYKSY